MVFIFSACSNDIQNIDRNQLSNTESVILKSGNNYSVLYNLDATIFPINSIISSNHNYILFNGVNRLIVTEEVLTNGVTITYSGRINYSNNSFGNEFYIYSRNEVVANGYILDYECDVDFVLDPYKTDILSSPLTGELKITTKSPVKIKYEIMKRDNSNIVDVSKISTEYLTNNILDIYGLYENYNNTVRIIGYNYLNNIEFEYTMKIKTENVVLEEYDNDKVLDIKINQSNNKGWFITHYNYLYPGMLIDEDGYVRWFFKNSSANYGFPVRVIDDNLIEIVPYYANFIKYYSYTGKEYIEKNIDIGTLGYQVHHDVYHKKDGNYLISAQEIGAGTIEDIVLEYDPATRQILHIWDFKKVIKNNSRNIISGYSQRDWLHINSVIYDERDDTIIISARHQGVIKATYPDDNGDFNIVWWLTPHTQVQETNSTLVSKLLKPLDKNGNIINDQDVLLGNTLHSDFEWNRGQHSAVLLNNGNILLYDNGNDRPYVTTGGEYSRLVEYKIDDNNLTVQQVRQYGKELGLDMYSWFRSNVYQFDNLNYFINSASVKKQFDIKEFDTNNKLLYDARGLWENYRIYKQKIFDEHYK